MRTKNRRAKSRPKQTPIHRSLRSSFDAARALPVLLSQDDESRQQSDRTHKIVAEMSSDSDGDDDDVGVVPHSVDKVEKEVNLSASMGNNNSEESLEEGTCIRCKGRERDEQVLVCSEIGCLVCVHEKCMGCKAWFDDSGKFYCPFCKQKRMLARVRETRRKVKDTKKALLNFLKSSKVGVNKGEEKLNGGDKRNEPCKLSSAGDGIFHDNENDLSDTEADNQGTILQEDGQKVVENAKLGYTDHDTMELENEVVQPNSSVVNSGNVGRREEVSSKEYLSEMQGHGTLKDGQEEDLGSDDSKDESIGKDKEETENFCTSHVAEERIEDEQEEDPEPMDVGEYDKVAIEALNTSHIAEERNADGTVKVSNKGAYISVSNNNESIEEDKEQIESETSDRVANANAISETKSLAKPSGRFKQRAGKVAHPQNDSPSIRSSPRLKRAFLRRKASAKKNTGVFYEKATTSKKSRESATQQHVMTVNFLEARRKRLHWTVEEEEILKEGVKEFSPMANVNIPWRKILEYGRHVFHETRSPNDLKDKWRNIAKDGARVNR